VGFTNTNEEPFVRNGHFGGVWYRLSGLVRQEKGKVTQLLQKLFRRDISAHDGSTTNGQSTDINSVAEHPTFKKINSRPKKKISVQNCECLRRRDEKTEDELVGQNGVSRRDHHKNTILFPQETKIGS